MNWLNFKKIIILCIMSAFFMPIYAEGFQENKNESWNPLKPDYVKLQYAGGMGLFSFGVGWEYGKREQWETDIILGYIPRYSTNYNKSTLTLKQNFIPWKTPLGKNVQWEPLECGLYMNTIFGREFWSREPDYYPKGYYGFSSRLRFHIFVGQRIRWNLPDKLGFMGKSITAFYEISSCDLYVVSAFVNHLDPEDYLRLSLGVKFNIF